MGGESAVSRREASSPFLKKRTKKLLFSGLFTPAWEHGYTALGAGVVMNG
jgi:hypothetical protein